MNQILLIVNFLNFSGTFFERLKSLVCHLYQCKLGVACDMPAVSAN